MQSTIDYVTRRDLREIIADMRAAGAGVQEPRLAERLTDVVMMLDAPDSYNREYIAAVCRSILSTLSRPDGK